MGEGKGERRNGGGEGRRKFEKRRSRKRDSVRSGRVATGICCNREDSTIDTPVCLLASIMFYLYACVRQQTQTRATDIHTCARIRRFPRGENRARATLLKATLHTKRIRIVVCICVCAYTQYAYRTHVPFRKMHICAVETRASANFAVKYISSHENNEENKKLYLNNFSSKTL